MKLKSKLNKTNKVLTRFVKQTIARFIRKLTGKDSLNSKKNIIWIEELKMYSLKR